MTNKISLEEKERRAILNRARVKTDYYKKKDAEKRPKRTYNATEGHHELLKLLETFLKDANLIEEKKIIEYIGLLKVSRGQM